MDALLILSGLLMMLCGWVWLIMRAFGTSLLWGLGSLLPPLTLAYMLGHWRKSSRPMMLATLGFIPLIVGLTLLASNDSERLAAILSLSWLKSEVKQPPELDIRLRGELNGQPFMPQQGELIDNILTLREGGDFFAQREVRIRLPEGGFSGALRLDVLPQDQGPVPAIEVSWRLPDQELPEARLVTQGYTLHLDLFPEAPNLMVGDFHLVLPEPFRTSLSGEVQLFTDRLRYRGGKVDTRFDSEDTLAYVVEDYLERRFSTRLVQLRKVQGISLPAQHLNMQIDTRINGKAQHFTLKLVKEERRGWHVEGDDYPALPHPSEKLATAPIKEEASGTVSQRDSGAVDRRSSFSLRRLEEAPSDYLGLRMHVVTLQGGKAEGRFEGIDTNGDIMLRRELRGPGTATYRLAPDNIRSIRLLEP